MFDKEAQASAKDAAEAHRVTGKHLRLIPGGKIELPDDHFEAEQLDKGTKVEKEHTDDPAIAKHIAKDHLQESGDYYRGLAVMEEFLNRKEAQASAKDVAEAAALTERDPSPAQIVAGNYAKGKCWVHGMQIAIETPAGAVRRGVGKNGQFTWARKLVNHYGYILKSVSEADGDHYDVFVGPHPESEIVFVVNQNKPHTKTFDEHKALLGFVNAAEAKAAYLANYHPDWDGFDSIVPMTIKQFKWHVFHDDTSKPVEDHWKKAAAAEQVYYHGSPHRFDVLRKGSWVTPYEDDALRFGIPWSTEDLANMPADDPIGRPPRKLKFNPGKDPADTALFVYRMMNPPVAPALTNTGAAYPWNRQITKEWPVELIREYKNWRDAPLGQNDPEPDETIEKLAAVIGEFAADENISSLDRRVYSEKLSAVCGEDILLKYADYAPPTAKPKAVIIKGNPRFIEDNPEAEAFYDAIAKQLETGGYEPSFDPGEEYTVPDESAALWVGHSRGADRLRFAPETVRTLALGSSLPGAVNHPEDDVTIRHHELNTAPTAAHYMLTDEMKKALGQATKQAAEFAPGLPAKKDFGQIDKLRAGQLYDYVRQEHAARRAGLHQDFRFGDPSVGGLLSWATRKGLPEPGGRHALFQQPVHTPEYADFEGEIESGYGAGHVKKLEKGKILVTRAKPGEIHFAIASRKHPERFVMVQTKDKNWLLVNTTPTDSKALEHDKIHYTKIPGDKAEETLANILPGSSVQEKIDGAHALIQLSSKGVEILSPRRQTGTNYPIVHTERFFSGRSPIEIPKELHGTVLRGELYGRRRPQDGVGVPTLGGQDVIPPAALGGLLNATVANSLAAQRQHGIDLRTRLFDIAQYGGVPIDPLTMPYAERRRLLEEIHQRVPIDRFELSPETKTGPEAVKLWQNILAGKNPLTREGVVLYPPVGRPQKAKTFEEANVHVRDVFPGEGKYQGKGVGGLIYSLEPEGPLVGRVGSGLTDQMRRQWSEDPQTVIGRKARIRYQEQFPSGAYRTPSLIALDE